MELTLGRLLFLVFLLVPLIEIACFVLIGQAIGLWPTLAGVLVTAVAGSLLLRFQGVALLNEIRSTVARGQLPARAIADALMVGVAGLLLLLPGYFSDLIGLLLLIPPVRHMLYDFLKRRMALVPAAMAGEAGRDDRRVSGSTIDLDEEAWRRR